MILQDLFNKINDEHLPLLRPYTELITDNGRSDVILKVSDTEFIYFEKENGDLISNGERIPIRPDSRPFVEKVAFGCRLSDNLLYKDVLTITRLLSYTSRYTAQNESWLSTNNDVRASDQGVVALHLNQVNDEEGLMECLSNIRMALVHGINDQSSIRRCIKDLVNCFRRFKQPEQARSFFGLFLKLAPSKKP